MSLRILITGSRDWRDEKAIGDALAAAWLEHGCGQALIVVNGGARGADAIAQRWACTMRNLGLPVHPEMHRADWDRYGKSAGHRRNAEMVARGADLVLAFPLGESRGTRGCMELARRAGIPVVDHGVDTASRGGAL